MMASIGRVLWLLRLRLRAARALWLPIITHGVAVPCLLTFVLAYQRHPPNMLTVTTGLAALASLTVCIRQVAHGMVTERVIGRLALLRTTPLSPGEWLGANILEGTIIGLSSLAPITIAFAIGQLAWPSSSYWIPLEALSLFVLSAGGALVGALVGQIPTVNLLSTVIIMSALALCPLLFSSSANPEWLRPIVDNLPPTLQAQGLRETWNDNRPPLREAFELLAWGLIFAVAAHYCLRRRAWVQA